MIYETIASFGDIYNKVYKKMFYLFEHYYKNGFERYNEGFSQKIEQIKSSYTIEKIVDLFGGFDFASFVDEIKEKTRSKTLSDEIVKQLKNDYYFYISFDKRRVLLEFLSLAFLDYRFREVPEKITLDFFIDYFEARKPFLTYKRARRLARILGDTRETLIFLEITPIKELRKIIYEFGEYYRENKFVRLSNGRTKIIIPVLREFIDSLEPLDENDKINDITYPEYIKLTGNNDEIRLRNHFVSLLFSQWMVWLALQWILLVKKYEKELLDSFEENKNAFKNDVYKFRLVFGNLYDDRSEDVCKFSPAYIFGGGITGFILLDSKVFLPPFYPVALGYALRFWKERIFLIVRDENYTGYIQDLFWFVYDTFKYELFVYFVKYFYGYIQYLLSKEEL
ncbi:MAG: hypothetical protein RMJ17_00375, partial [Candidatus Aenigmarchaeota archaeon]|nr:hypothetical protein [Candidatus Aenigmarchaeota archaeon]MDW8149045.1 hypothetical protein [Candidatus Aenigmarchaeota archaeon]